VSSKPTPRYPLEVAWRLVVTSDISHKIGAMKRLLGGLPQHPRLILGCASVILFHCEREAWELEGYCQRLLS
jgi:hypothetical protein